MKLSTTIKGLGALLLVFSIGCGGSRESAKVPGPKAHELVDSIRVAQDEEVEEIEPTDVGVEAIPLLGTLIEDEDRRVGLAASRALEAIVHHACRPGSDEERGQATTALCELLLREPPLKESSRIAFLDLLSVTADDPYAIQDIASLLSDPTLGPIAVRTLERIPSEEADEALLSVARDIRSPIRANAINALGAKRSEVAVDDLLKIESGADRELAARARHSLSSIADPRALNALQNAALDDEPGAITELFSFASRLLEDGNDDGARAIYARFVDDDRSHVRTASVYGLGTAGGDRSEALLVEKLSDDDVAVSRCAEAALVDVAQGSLLESLAREFSTKDAMARAAILRILSARKAEGVESMLRDGVEDPDVFVRLTAIDLLSTVEKPSATELLWTLATTREGDEQDVALKSYLAHAEALRRDGKAEEALSMNHRTLEMEVSEDVSAKALQGVMTIASADSLEHLERLSKREGQRENVARARFAIAKAIADDNPELAKDVLGAVYTESGNRGRRNAARKKLEDLGVDTSIYPLMAGFLLDWHILGPFPEATSEDFDTKPFETVDLEGEVAFEDGPRTWKAHTTKDSDGLVDLVQLFEKKNSVCAYAVTTIHADGASKAMLKIGSDDGVAVWLNGVQVHSNNTPRGVTIDQDKIEVELNEGANTLVLKVNQGGGDWGFCVRLADEEGTPVDLSVRSS